MTHTQLDTTCLTFTCLTAICLRAISRGASLLEAIGTNINQLYQGVTRHLPGIPTLQRLLASLGCAMLLSACASGLPKGITPVQDFEVDRYLGTWYEIVRLDHSFERGLSNVTARYSLMDDGRIQVINRGLQEDGEWSEAEGTARFARDRDVGYLEVSFFGPFYGTYAVFELDEDYTRAYVAGDDRSYLWFLSRTPEVSDEQIEAFVARAEAEGFPVEELIFVDHSLAERS